MKKALTILFTTIITINSFAQENKTGCVSGDYENGKKDGYGISTIGSGISKYKGYWQNDEKNGNGKEIFSNGNMYEGEYKDDAFLKGTYTFKSGHKYIGEFLDSKRNGFGKYYLEDGSLYFEGQFKDGNPVK